MRHAPALNVQIFEKGDAYGHKISATLERLTAAGETLYEAPPGTYNGAYGYDAREAVFTFSQEPLGSCTVEIESWDRSKKETLTLDDWQNPFPLPAEPAHYRILAVFSRTDGRSMRPYSALNLAVSTDKRKTGPLILQCERSNRGLESREIHNSMV